MAIRHSTANRSFLEAVFGTIKSSANMVCTVTEVSADAIEEGAKIAPSVIKLAPRTLGAIAFGANVALVESVRSFMPNKGMKKMITPDSFLNPEKLTNEYIRYSDSLLDREEEKKETK